MNYEKKRRFSLVENITGETVRGFQKRNASAHEQNVWHVISTNATVLANNPNSRKEVEGRS